MASEQIRQAVLGMAILLRMSFSIDQITIKHRRGLYNVFIIFFGVSN